jgi:DUF177 domain-containing protein
MPNTRTHPPRGALVFDMRLLGRQAGSSLPQARTVPAPDDLRLELVGVPVGADVALEVRFEAVSEGVLATGTATAPLAGECARCLAPLTSSVTASFQELYLYADGRHDRHDKHDRHDRHDKHDRHDRHDRHDKHDDHEEQDDDERYLDGDLLDLEPAFRDAVVLALPMSPLCREDCPGLCAECGVPLADAGPGHRHGAAADPRWAALKQFDDQATSQQDRRAGAIDLQEG